MANLLDINNAQDVFNQATNVLSDKNNQLKSDGFTVPASFSSDGNSLPYGKVPSLNKGQFNRNIITWFVPEFGIVRMYVNPQSISYAHKKAIYHDRTKGGYTVQYWGEQLTTLNINGTTGSSGVEGINMLYEIYRAEQYSFDSIGLTLDAANAATSLANNIAGGIGDAIGGGIGDAIGGDIGSGIGDAIGGSITGALGGDSQTNSLANKNIPSLAQLACGVEMYYNGWVFRGFFTDMTMTEKATDFLWDYQMTFVVTQKRGYRTNYFPFHKSANNGPSQYETPNSFDGNLGNKR